MVRVGLPFGTALSTTHNILARFTICSNVQRRDRCVNGLKGEGPVVNKSLMLTHEEVDHNDNSLSRIRERSDKQYRATLKFRYAASYLVQGNIFGHNLFSVTIGARG